MCRHNLKFHVVRAFIKDKQSSVCAWSIYLKHIDAKIQKFWAAGDNHLLMNEVRHLHSILSLHACTTIKPAKTDVVL
jgi:hypothetical protein